MSQRRYGSGCGTCIMRDGEDSEDHASDNETAPDNISEGFPKMSFPVTFRIPLGPPCASGEARATLTLA